MAQLDSAPDDATAAGGPRYVFDPRALARVPAVWSLSLPAADGGADGRIELLPGPGESDISWLLLYPSDDFAGPGDQMKVLRPGAEQQIYLPLTINRSGFESSQP